MGTGRKWAALAAALALNAPAMADAQTPAGAPQYVTFTEEAPCPPSSAAPLRRATVRRRHRIVHPHRVAVRHVVRPHPPVLHRVRVVHRVRPHRPALVHASAPIAPKRCTVVRRERLTPASFGLTPEEAMLTPVDDDVTPGGPVISQPSSSGRAPFGDVPNPSTGGGDPGEGGGGPVSAAPEPGGWALMLLGVGLAGIALRRRRPASRLS